MECVPYQNIREAARFTGVPEYFLRKLLKAERLPGFYAGRAFKVNVPALLQMLEQQSSLQNREASK